MADPACCPFANRTLVGWVVEGVAQEVVGVGHNDLIFVGHTEVVEGVGIEGSADRRRGPWRPGSVSGGRMMVEEGGGFGDWVYRMMDPLVFGWVFVDRVMVGERVDFEDLTCRTRGP